MSSRLTPLRPSAVAAHAMVAASQPLATRAGLRMLERGGNAVDAAIAAAAVLCVTEPMSTGVGGDCFALVSRDGEITGLDSSGQSPAGAAAHPVASRGTDAVTVPGAVRGWEALADRYGRFGLDTCIGDAIEAADRGFGVGAHCARLWADADHRPDEFSPAPRVGTRVRLPDLRGTLRRIADEGPGVLYEGELAAAIATASWLEESDLAAFRPRWVEPLCLSYRGIEVIEMPPPTQGVAALEALGLLQHLPVGFSSQVNAVRLSLADAAEHVRDGADVSFLLEPEFLRRRADEIAIPVPSLQGGTVYLCAVDEDRMAVSFIQSLFAHFGSGVVVPGTGIVLNNRAACFSVEGAVSAGRRPYHTTIPGLLRVDGELLGPFGIMGGFVQAQAHAQFVTRVVDEGLDPQAALDQPRFRIDGSVVHLERGHWDKADDVRAMGMTPVLEQHPTLFGAGQAIFCEGDVLLGGSDARRDGYAAGY